MDVTIVDVIVNGEMEGLERVLKAHKKLSLQLDDVPPFFPDEILANADDLDLLDKAWGSQNYDFIRKEYCSIWIAFYEYVYDELTEFVVDDFLSGKVGKFL